MNLQLGVLESPVLPIELRAHYGSPCWIRTSDPLINSQVHYRCAKGEYGGECEIRTHGAVTPAGFQDRCLKPLGQLSIMAERIGFEPIPSQSKCDVLPLHQRPII